MLVKIQALEDNKVWNIIRRQSTTGANDAVERFKARLVPCGNEQAFGVATRSPSLQ